MNRITNLSSFSILHSLSSTQKLHSLIPSPTSHNSLLSARTVLLQTRYPQPVILYNSLIRSFARSRHFPHAFSLFTHLLSSQTRPDSFTFATLLHACADNRDPLALQTLHGLVLSSGFASDLIPITTLISCYSKLGRLDDAHQVFDEMCHRDLVVCNAMLSGLGYGGFWENGLRLFCRMRECGQNPDGFSLVGLLSCFWDPSAVQFGRGVHGFVLKVGFEGNSHVRSVLVSMYCRMDCLDSGYRVFREIHCPDLVTWSAIITGVFRVGRWNEAIRLFKEMSGSLTRRPDSVLIASFISACGAMAASGSGREIHCYAIRVGMDSDVAVSSALIDFYCKCGFSQLGLRVFEAVPNKNSITYNAVITGLGSNGLGFEAIGVFEKMLEDGFKPDKATFSGVLCACAHSGLLEEGSTLFARMKDDFGIEPEIEHYVYMVKLLGLVGELDEAYELIKGMPELPGSDSGVWGALLWGCGIHGRSDLGEIAGRMLFERDPEKGAYGVMLSNVYASENKWGNVESVRENLKGEKVTGLSWVGNSRS